MTETLHRMLEYLSWANVRVLEHLHAEGEGLNEPLGLYAHILSAERIWLDRIDGVAPGGDDVWPAWSLEECARVAEENLTRFVELATGLSPDDLNREITYRNTRGAEYTDRLHDMLVHVVMHGAYHRGQIAASLREVGVVPAGTDFIVFVRDNSTD